MIIRINWSYSCHGVQWLIGIFSLNNWKIKRLNPISIKLLKSENSKPSPILLQTGCINHHHLYSHVPMIGMMQIRTCSEHCTKVDEFIQSNQQLQSITISIPMMQSIVSIVINKEKIVRQLLPTGPHGPHRLWYHHAGGQARMRNSARKMWISPGKRCIQPAKIGLNQQKWWLNQQTCGSNSQKRWSDH